MRYWIYFLLLPLVACGGREAPGVRVEKEGHVAADSSAAAHSAVADGVRYYRGTLNGKIPVAVWLRVIDADSIVEGAVTYTAGKSKTPIRLLGTLTSEGCYISEFLPDGTVSGIWGGRLTATGFSGNWSAPLGNKQYTFTLQPADTAISVPDYRADGDITGTYEFRYGEEGGMGALNVQQLGNGRMIYNIDANIGAPSFNTAATEEETLGIQGYTAVYHSSDEFGECSYRIRIYRDFAVVDYPTEDYMCGFGHNASVAGVFLKTGRQYQKPSFGDLRDPVATGQ